MASVNKWLEIGNLGRDPKNNAALRNRLLSFVRTSVSSDCWQWSGAKSRGYGLLSNGWKKSPHKAHRLSYELFIGEIPSGMVVRHKYDNPECINPDHLEIVTHKDNVHDRVSRGRTNPISLLNLHPGQAGVCGAGKIKQGVETWRLLIKSSSSGIWVKTLLLVICQVVMP